MQIAHAALTIAALAATLASAAPVPSRVGRRSHSSDESVRSEATLLRREPKFGLPEMTGNQALSLGGAVAGAIGLALYEVGSSFSTKANVNGFRASLNIYQEKRRKAEAAQAAAYQAQVDIALLDAAKKAAAAAAAKRAPQKPLTPKHTDPLKEVVGNKDGSTHLQRRGRDDILKEATNVVEGLGRSGPGSETAAYSTFNPTRTPGYGVDPSSSNGSNDILRNLVQGPTPSSPQATQPVKRKKKSRFDSNNAIYAALMGGWTLTMGVHSAFNGALSYDMSKRMDLSKVHPKPHARRSLDDEVPPLLRREEAEEQPTVVVVPAV